MKKSIALLVAVAVTSAAFAAPTKPHAPTAPKTIHCAVMKTDTVNIADATKHKQYADYKGRRYYFCCDMCPTAFKKNPEKFAKNESLPTPKATKAH